MFGHRLGLAGGRVRIAAAIAAMNLALSCATPSAGCRSNSMFVWLASSDLEVIIDCEGQVRVYSVFCDASPEIARGKVDFPGGARGIEISIETAVADEGFTLEALRIYKSQRKLEASIRWRSAEGTRTATAPVSGLRSERTECDDQVWLPPR